MCRGARTEERSLIVVTNKIDCKWNGYDIYLIFRDIYHIRLKTLLNCWQQMKQSKLWWELILREKIVVRNWHIGLIIFIIFGILMINCVEQAFPFQREFCVAKTEWVNIESCFNLNFTLWINLHHQKHCILQTSQQN